MRKGDLVATTRRPRRKAQPASPWVRVVGSPLFSDYFDVAPAMLEAFGAFDINVTSDLPLFIDPFLLFNSDRPEYQQLHRQIVDYLTFLAGMSDDALDTGVVRHYYGFKEVRQNCLGFTRKGTSGHGLGRKFAGELNKNLARILSSDGITETSHFEKFGLIQRGVGRDTISDFVTNMLKDFLLTYTERFARLHVSPAQGRDVAVAKAVFDSARGEWKPKTYYLPVIGDDPDDYVILTPADLLTRDEAWINRAGMISSASRLPAAVPDEELRGRMDRFFQQALRAARVNKDPKPEQRAAEALLREFPELVDYYIAQQEEHGEQAHADSAEKTTHARQLFTETAKALMLALLDEGFYQHSTDSFVEAGLAIAVFKHYVEHKDGWKLLNGPGRKPSSEEDVQLFFGLVFSKTMFDVNREPNNGRGPVDYKVSMGAQDKTLIEIKLASNSSLKRNLANQVEVYKQANQTEKSYKLILVYTDAEMRKVNKVLDDLKLAKDPTVVVVDAGPRKSASKV